MFRVFFWMSMPHFRKPAFGKTSLGILAFVAALLALTVPALAQTPPPPQPGGILNNPDAPRPRPPANPSGLPPLPTIIPPTILTPGSGR